MRASWSIASLKGECRVTNRDSSKKCLKPDMPGNREGVQSKGKREVRGFGVTASNEVLRSRLFPLATPASVCG